MNNTAREKNSDFERGRQARMSDARGIIRALFVLLGGTQLSVLLFIASVATISLVPLNELHAANGQCKWEGGQGKNGGFAYCAAEDCVGQGGLAQCSVPVGAAMSGFSDAQVDFDKWIYSADNGYTTQPVNRMWCLAAGGTWYADTANPQCINLPPDVLAGGGRVTGSEDRTVGIGDAFVPQWFGSCGSMLFSDTGWAVSHTTLGIPTEYDRVRHYIAVGGPNCTGYVDITLAKQRQTKCPPGYNSRSSAGSTQCFIPAECPVCVGNPVSAATGTKYQKEEDYVSPQTGLEFSRYFRSSGYYWPEYLVSLGATGDLKRVDFWRHSYDRRFIPVSGNSEVMAVLQRPDGSLQVFDTSGAEKTIGEGGGGAHVQVVSGIGWDVTLANSDVERYDGAGRLITITTRAGRVTQLAWYGNFLLGVMGPYGHTLVLHYNDNHELDTVTLPDGSVIRYDYAPEQKKLLSAVTYPDGKSRGYYYGDVRNRYLLTNIVDEANQTFATYVYDQLGRVTSESHAGGVASYSFTYGSSFGQPTAVTDPLGTVTQFAFTPAGGMYRSASYSQPCMSCGSAATTYDANGNPATRTDFNGNQTTYSFDATRNLETSRTEASGTPRARTITTQWHPTFRLPTQIDEPGRRTTISYDGSGNALTRTTTDTVTSVSRTWSYTYNGQGQVLSVDGPRSDVSDTTQLTYSSCTTGAACGQLATVTDAAGNLTTFSSYDGNGLPLSITDPNGTITTLTYDARQRITSKAVAGETTQIDYWPTGLLKKVTLPDGSFVSYDYDAAHRLTKITDTDGNSIVYTLDGAGNRIAEQTFDAQQTLVLSKTRVFDSLGRLQSESGSAGQTVNYGYDAAGNRVSLNDAMGRVTTYGYDQLNRLATVTDALLSTTQFGYDALDDLLSVIDPRGLTTSYAYNGLGDNTGLTSPDTGVGGYTRDAAGNLDVATDARSKTAAYHYDALGRVTQIVRSDQTIAFTYDQGATGRGHLTGMQDGAGTTSWAYDGQGRVTQRTQTTGAVTLAVGYAYDTLGHLTAITTPSGRTIAYSYSSGRVSALAVSGVNVLHGVTYRPFGPTTGWQWGSGATTTRAYDTDGQLVSVSSAGASTYTFFPDGLIKSRTDDYSASIPLTSGTTSFSISSTSNRLQSATGLINRTYSYDAAGNTVGDGARSFTYDDAGRMATSTSGGVTTTYSYNGLGERVKKSSSAATVYFAYDEAGHLVGEYDASGALIEETVWFGDIPVATLRPSGGSGVHIYYVHADHLNTPRRVTDSANDTIVWRWDSEPYGSTAANEDPDGDMAAFTYNLRFPGQYFDTETGLHYNYFRDYDPVAGKYVEPDPAGILTRSDDPILRAATDRLVDVENAAPVGLNSEYAYADVDPLARVDPLGLWSLGDPLPQWVVDYSSGLGDVLSFGITYEIRAAADLNGVVNFCSGAYWAGAATGVAIHIVGFRTGGELRLGRNFRIAPWGNRTGDAFGELPHYHRRIVDESGNTIPGGGIGRHRPWQGF
jgi:RHS repeat-associated protein